MDTTTTTTIPAAQTAPAPEGTPSTQVKLTSAAVAQVKKVIQDQGFQDYFFSIRVVPAGCSGLGYDLNLVRRPSPRTPSGSRTA